MAVSRSVKLRVIRKNIQTVFFMFRHTECRTYIVEVSRNK